MSDVRMVKLGDIGQVISGATPKTSVPEYWGGDIYWATPKDLSRLESAYIDSTERTITESGKASCATSILPENSVLLSSRAPIGHVAINTTPMATNQGFKSIIPTNDVIPKYLYYWLSANKYYIQSMGNGATFKEISKKVVESIVLPLPPLEEQKRIVSILDKAKSIQEARERQLAALDELASSLFVKYFGHPSLSPKYKTVSIGDICKVATGNSPSKKDINNYGNVIEWVKSDNLGGLHPSKAKEYLSEQGKNKGRVAPPGSILVTCIAGSRNSIGKCSLVDREITFNQQINAIYPSNNILSDFLYYQIKIFPYLVQEKISGGMKGIVNKSKFESIKIILPPKEIQEEFSKITQRIRIQKEYAKKSLDLSKNLFSSLEINLFYH